MLALRDLECLVALARHKHFARAADACGLSQPAFSMRIRGLEAQLDTQIVKRGNRFQGLTAEGEVIVDRARTIIGHVRALEQEVRAAHGEVTGALTIGTIPTASAYAARVANWLRRAYPGITTRIETASSLTIQQGVDDGRFDAGITYTEGAATDLLAVDALYVEHYVLLAPQALAPPGADRIGWAEAAAMPLILLDREMQNRRILDQVFEEVGVQPDVVAETNGLIAAMAMAAQGAGATVIPQVLVEARLIPNGARCLTLVDPTVEKSVSLVTLRKDRRIPVVEALKRVLLTER